MKLEVGKEYNSKSYGIVACVAKHKEYFVCISRGGSTLACDEGGYIDDIVHIISEYIEPVKYSVDVWFDETPKPGHTSNLLGTFIFGEGAAWNRHQYKDCIRKFRITVEEANE